MSNVKRVYVEKKSGFDVQAKELKTEIRSYLGIKDVDSVRVLIRWPSVLRSMENSFKVVLLIVNEY